MLTKSISKNSLILTAFALVTASVLAVTFKSTEQRISAAERQAAQKALFEIIPLTRHNNDMLHDTQALTAEQLAQLGFRSNDSANLHIAKMDNQRIAVIVPALAKDGYSGDIKLIIGVNRDGTIAGVRALSHKETPGLGDKVDLKKSPWVLMFNGRSLQSPKLDRWAVKKDGGEFDQFTGATITPRAVVNQVKNALLFVKQHHSEIFAKTQSSPSQTTTVIENN